MIPIGAKLDVVIFLRYDLYRILLSPGKEQGAGNLQFEGAGKTYNM